MFSQKRFDACCRTMDGQKVIIVSRIGDWCWAHGIEARWLNMLAGIPFVERDQKSTDDACMFSCVDRMRIRRELDQYGFTLHIWNWRSNRFAIS